MNALLASGGTEGLDLGKVLLHLCIVLVAAKVAAELAERVGIPSVLGEIAAGIAIGPSVLGWVQADQIISVLGELGVILLLLNVGLEMDVAELARVGRSSLLVAVIGVAAPFGMGIGAGVALGHDVKASVFLGAALTATSVGITARVFGDLGALSTTESRIVLGAAVADDVLGLIILTVVTRVVVDGSVSLVSILGITGLALGFLIVTGVAGARITPGLFAFVGRYSKSSSTLIALAFAFTLAFSTLADSARLAPIIGAFMAGLALARTKQAERIERDLAPLGHVFIPIFFLSIGIKTDIAAIGRPSVLGLAGVLTVVAIIGKLVAAGGALGTRSDKWLIGLGMIPRGEVGLIFAALGLQTGVFDKDLYAALIVVVLATTVMTPPLLRMRTLQLARRQGAITDDGAEAAEPSGGWIEHGGNAMGFRVDPPARLLLPLALEAAGKAEDLRPNEAMIAWFERHRSRPLSWDAGTTRSFIELLRTGGPRTWRFLETLGVLERAVPEVSRALRARRSDPSELDPMRVLRFPTIDRLRDLLDPDDGDTKARSSYSGITDTDALYLAALVLDLADVLGERAEIARSVLQQFSVDGHDEQEAATLVADGSLLLSSLHQPDVLDEDVVRQLAEHIGSDEARRNLYVLTLARRPLDAFEHAMLDELDDRIAQCLQSGDGLGLCDSRRAAARLLATTPEVAERIAHAPRSYILANEPDELVRQAELAEPAPRPGTVRVAVSGDERIDCWRVDVATVDRHGLLAVITGSLTDAGLDILSASAATWGDRVVVDSFLTRSSARPSARELSLAIESGLRLPLPARPLADAEIRFDNSLLPWFTSCTVEVDDRPGVLAAITTAFAGAGVEVHSARIDSFDGVARDRFSLSMPDGSKLDDSAIDRVRRALESGARTKTRRRR